MANIINYIKWRGDLDFEKAPFNEVDGLAFSLLIYNDLYGIVSDGETGGEITIKNAADMYFTTHSKEGLSRGDFDWVLLYMSKYKRFADITLSDYLDINNADKDMLFTAMTIHLPDGSLFVAFRGTTMDIDDWRLDFKISFEEIMAQKQAVSYLRYILAKYAGDVYIGGHSKGGNLALYSAMHVPGIVQGRIKHIYSYDGPGICPELLDESKFENARWKLTHIVPTYSIVGMLFELDVPHKIVASDAKRMLQHSGMTWKIEGDHFVTRKHLSKESSDLNRVIDDWIGNATMEQREAFTRDVFDAMKAGGASSLDDISKGGFHDFGTILLSAAQSESKTKIIIGKFFGSLWREFEKIRVTEALKTQQGIIDAFLILLGIVFLAIPKAIYNMIGGAVALTCALFSATRILKAGTRDEKAFIKRGRMLFHIIVMCFMVFIVSNIERIPKWTNVFISIVFFTMAVASVQYVIKHKKTIKRAGSFWMILIAVVNLNIGIISLATPQRLTSVKSLTVGSYLVLIGIVRLLIQILSKKSSAKDNGYSYEDTD
ncbi:MAG: DUF2974 domain-containing protein [Butyrivibrio sp.]|nr:DUF2974 domain-containing protein [Butyrivibrio sp.]